MTVIGNCNWLYMLHCIIVSNRNNNCDGNNVSTTLMLQVNALQLMPILRLGASFAALGAVLFTFRPLLVGIVRAAWLLAFPRLSREQRAGRDQMRDQRLIQKMIAASTGPSLTAELRAMAARD